MPRPDSMRGFQLHVAMWLTGSINPNSSLTSSGIEVRSWAPANVVNGGNGRCMFLRVPGGEVDPTGSISRQAGSDGGKRNSSPGRARHKPSNQCAGNAGVLRLYMYARVRTSSCTLHTRPRVQQAPGIPCSLISEGRNSSKPRAQVAPREGRLMFTNVDANKFDVPGEAPRQREIASSALRFVLRRILPEHAFVALQSPFAIRPLGEPVGNPDLRVDRAGAHGDTG